MRIITKKEKEIIWFALRMFNTQDEPEDAVRIKKLLPIFDPHTTVVKYKCDCGWEGKDSEMSIKTFRNGGDESVCPSCGQCCDEILRESEEEMAIDFKVLSEGKIIAENGNDL